MGISGRLVVMGVALFLTACTTPGYKHLSADFIPPAERTRIVLMPPDVSMSLLTAGGLIEPRADWTGEAERNIVQSFGDVIMNYGHELAMARGDIPAADSQVQLVLLHQEVSSSVSVFDPSTEVMVNTVVPSKQDAFDWTLGADAAELATSYDAGLALFVSSHGSFSGGGRVAVAAVSAVLFGVVPNTGARVTRASLVDLHTGDIVWMNFVAGGDPRTLDGAQQIVDALVTDVPL